MAHKWQHLQCKLPHHLGDCQLSVQSICPGEQEHLVDRDREELLRQAFEPTFPEHLRLEEIGAPDKAALRCLCELRRNRNEHRLAVLDCSTAQGPGDGIAKGIEGLRAFARVSEGDLLENIDHAGQGGQCSALYQVNHNQANQAGHAWWVSVGTHLAWQPSLQSLHPWNDQQE